MKTSTNCLHINNIRVYGYTGYKPEEKTNGQWFEVNLKLWVDMSISRDTDRLEDTLNYITVIAQVEDIVRKSNYHLIEKLASHILHDIMDRHMIAVRAHIVLTKMNPPIPNFGGNVSIEMTQER